MTQLVVGGKQGATTSHLHLLHTLESQGLVHLQSLDVVHCRDRLDVLSYSERKEGIGL